MTNAEEQAAVPPARRLTKDARRRQLLETARVIVRDEGADRLTLGRLAARAGISKPIAYDHFGTRSALLVELYRLVDTEKVQAFADAMARDQHGAADTVDLLAAAYVDCAADTGGEAYAVGAALAGNEQTAAVLQELLDAAVQMFVSVLRPHSDASDARLERRCVALVGAGEALSAAVVRAKCSRAEAVEEFAALIHASLAGPTQRTETS